MAYDSAIISYTTKTNKVDLVDAAHINAVQSEIITIETILGVGVKGNRSNLVTRLNNAMDADGSLLSGTAFPSPALSSQLFYRTDLSLLYIYTGSAWSNLSAGADSVTAGDVYIGGRIPCKLSSAVDGKVDEVLSRYVGTLRIKFSVGNQGKGEMQLYKNGSPIGTARAFNNSASLYSEDISNIAQGDLIQLYVTAWSSQFRWSGIEIYCAENYIPANIKIYSFQTSANSGTQLTSAGSIGDIATSQDDGKIYVKSSSTVWTEK